MACVYWVDILYILIAQAPDRDVLTGQKPDSPDQGIAIRLVYPVLPLKGVALPVKAIHSSRLRQNNYLDRKISSFVTASCLKLWTCVTME